MRKESALTEINRRGGEEGGAWAAWPIELGKGRGRCPLVEILQVNRDRETDGGEDETDGAGRGGDGVGGSRLIYPSRSWAQWPGGRPG